MVQRPPRDLPIPEIERLAQGCLKRLFPPEIQGGGLKTTRTGDGPRAFERVDLEPSEAFQHRDLSIGRYRHHHLRICGEDHVAHLGEAASQDLRIAEDVVAKRDAQKNFFRRGGISVSGEVGRQHTPVP